jgi:hypothetical protein
MNPWLYAAYRIAGALAERARRPQEPPTASIGALEEPAAPASPASDPTPATTFPSPRQVVLVGPERALFTCSRTYREGSDDYTLEYQVIEQIIDAQHREYEGVFWAAEWTEICPGIATRSALVDGKSISQVQIAAAACPVYLGIRERALYGSRTDGHHRDLGSYTYWVGFTAAPPPPDLPAAP